MSTKDDPPRPSRRPLSSDDLADAAEQFDDCDADGDQRIDFKRVEVTVRAKLASLLSMA